MVGHYPICLGSNDPFSKGHGDARNLFKPGQSAQFWISVRTRFVKELEREDELQPTWCSLLEGRPAKCRRHNSLAQSRSFDRLVSGFNSEDPQSENKLNSKDPLPNRPQLHSLFGNHFSEKQARVFHKLARAKGCTTPRPVLWVGELPVEPPVP